MPVGKTTVVYWLIIGLLLLTVVGMALKFLVLGKTEMSADGRIAIVLDAPERAVVLNEMRQFLGGIQLILEQADRGDAASIAKTARPLGIAAAHNVPASLVAKLPLEFKTLGHSVHADFDRIAMDATEFGDARHALQQLAETMKKCVACHATYQITTASVAVK